LIGSQTYPYLLSPRRTCSAILFFINLQHRVLLLAF
jgi:hypothetical protein